MDFIWRLLGGGTIEGLHPQLQASTSSRKSPKAAKTPPDSPQLPRVHFDTLPATHRSQSRHQRTQSMPSRTFDGPSCKNLVSFMKSIQSIPAEHKVAFDSISKEAIDAVTNANALHIWESDSDIDNLLQLTQVIIKLRNPSQGGQNGETKKKAGMIIIAEVTKERDNFGRLVELVRHLTNSDGKRRLDGTVCAFGAIVVVHGVDYSANTDHSATVQRVSTTIERVLEMMSPPKRRIVWHHGPKLPLLLSWINTTTSQLRNALAAITVTAALDFANGVKPSPLGRKALEDFQRLEFYAKKLKVPIVFLDPGSQLIMYPYLATYMFFWAFYIHAFLPSSLTQAHLHKALDELVTFCFRLRGRSEGRYGDEVVERVRRELDPGKAKHWAKSCINPASYSKEACRTAAKDTAIQHAVQTADAPFATFNCLPEYPLPAFSRLIVGPSAPSTTFSSPTGTFNIAAPVAFDFKNCTLKAASTSPFRILLPQTGQDEAIVSGRIQGMMMGVLQRVREDKGNPTLGSGEREVWKAVVKACTWALDGCKGKMSEGVENKVKYAREKFRDGTWTFVLGLTEQGANHGGVKEQMQQSDWRTGGMQQSGVWR